MSRAAFLLINRNKEMWVGQAVRGALAQTYPCHILISDQQSTDNSLSVIRAEVENYLAQRNEYVGGEPFHTIRIVWCPIIGPYSMRSCNDHLQWCIEQLPPEIEWVFQCSSDDYSLPDRVKVCMEAINALEMSRAQRPFVGVCNAMFFDEPDGKRTGSTGWPAQQGFIPAGEGLTRLAYGSTIWGYRRDWLLKIGLQVNCTLDVYLGFLAALDGLYYVANPQHVHVTHASVENMGFQGKLLAATGDESLILNELNQFQLLALYFDCAERAQQLHQGLPAEAQNGIVQKILDHAQGLLQTRTILNAKGIQPGILV